MPPLGQERWSASPVLPASRCDNPHCVDPHCLAIGTPNLMNKEESMDSIVGVTGSMADLVRGAREVRKLIREASFDSLTSDFSMELKIREDLGASTELNLDNLHSELLQLHSDCSAINERVDVNTLDMPKNTMTSSKSDFSVNSSAALHSGPPSSSGKLNVAKEGSTPDLRALQRPKRHFWKINDIAESEESSLLSSPLTSGSYNNRNNGVESLEWESPNHGWHDLRKTKYKLALGSSRAASEYGGDEDEARSVLSHLTCGSDKWEWDCEGFTSSAHNFDGAYHMLTPTSMLHHQKWLPEHADRIELDLETELSTSASTSASHPAGDRFYYFYNRSMPHAAASSSRSSSRRSSLDRSAGPSYYAFKVRQPPSGRSSVDQGSGDTPRDAIDHASLVKSFGVCPPSDPDQSLQAMVKSTSSDESGFQDGFAPSSQNTSSNTIFAASGVALSPVHEAKEPGSAATTPVKKSSSFSAADHARIRRTRLFSNREETLQVVIDRKKSE